MNADRYLWMVNLLLDYMSPEQIRHLYHYAGGCAEALERVGKPDERIAMWQEFESRIEMYLPEDVEDDKYPEYYDYDGDVEP